MEEPDPSDLPSDEEKYHPRRARDGWGRVRGESNLGNGAHVPVVKKKRRGGVFDGQEAAVAPVSEDKAPDDLQNKRPVGSGAMAAAALRDALETLKDDDDEELWPKSKDQISREEEEERQQQEQEEQLRLQEEEATLQDQSPPEFVPAEPTKAEKDALKVVGSASCVLFVFKFFCFIVVLFVYAVSEQVQRAARKWLRKHRGEQMPDMLGMVRGFIQRRRSMLLKIAGAATSLADTDDSQKQAVLKLKEAFGKDSLAGQTPRVRARSAGL